MKTKLTTVSYSNPAALTKPRAPFSHVAIAPEGLVAIDRNGKLVGAL